jgi:Flp pilus assembly protein TadG
MNVINHNAASPGADIEISFLSERIRARLRASSDEGQSLLEFALCVPVLLLLVTGIMTFGLALNNYLVMTNAVSTSAQLLSVSRSNTTDPCSLTATSFTTSAPNLTASNLSFTYVLNGVSYGPYKGLSASTCSSSSTSTGAAGNLVAGQSAEVTVSYPCNLAVYGHNYLPTCNLVVQTTEIVQ